MKDNLPNLSNDQWSFLAVLKVWKSPVHIDIAGTIAPLLPGPLFDLIKRAKKTGWIRYHGKDLYSLKSNLPENALLKIQEIITKEFFSMIVDRLQSEGMVHRIPQPTLVHLLREAGRDGEACILEIELSHQAIRENNPQKAFQLLKQTVEHLYDSVNDPEMKTMFISTVMEWSNLSFTLWQGLPDMEKYLTKAQEMAHFLGDKRSHALINLHIGRLYYFSDHRTEAAKAFALGSAEVRELGDTDILLQASGLLGIFHFMNGQYREALVHLEQAEKLYLSSEYEILNNITVLFFLPYCAFYLGQFYRAIGSLESNLSLARKHGDQATASTLRAVMGLLLAFMKKRKEAGSHLSKALDESTAINNSIGIYVARGGLAVLSFLENKVESAYELMNVTASEGARAGLVRQFSSPVILEILYEFHRLGFQSLPLPSYSQTLDRVWSGDNIHLKGVALRLVAQEMIANRDDEEVITACLDESINLLREAGDPVQLSKTLLEKAHLNLLHNDRKGAVLLSQQAWRELEGSAEDLFPDEFRHLISDSEFSQTTRHTREDFVKRFLEMTVSLIPVEDEQEMLTRAVRSINRLLGAQRGGLFWFPMGKYTSKPELRASSNLSQNDVNDPGFHPNLEVILKSFRKNQPFNVRSIKSVGSDRDNNVNAVLCIPFESGGKVCGVFYHDNTYLNDAFDFLDASMLTELVRHTNHLVENITHFMRIKEERNIFASEKILRKEDQSQQKILGQSVIMKNLLDQADRVACSESTILILGETGTGKELLVKRIHGLSGRSEGPLVIVDCTTIPENLVESELFGHEKGAFTGADRLKHGRVELSHKGTLFMDEIGELPLQGQTKLLRTLQEKTFVRVGGMCTYTSDFRLICATNRDLAKEVAAGRFREDLFYRINVIPLKIPPLRDRGEDIIVLAYFFLQHFARKYERYNIELSPHDITSLIEYNWPGNVRELENLIERVVILSDGTNLELNLTQNTASKLDKIFSEIPTLAELQQRYIKYIFEYTGGKISGPGGVAETLGLKRTSLYSRMRSLSMTRKDFNSN